jgi:hypothetical protein
MKPIVRVCMKYNTGLPAGTHVKTPHPHLPASWTATVDSSTLPPEFKEAVIRASGFARSQALLGVERQLKSYSIPFVLEVTG